MSGRGWVLGVWVVVVGQVVAQAPPVQQPPAVPASDYNQRVVAYIHGTIPITREDLGEYLIARGGAEKLELLVNKKIIDHACSERGITVTAAEVEAALAEDLKSISVNKKDFVEKVLTQYGKTLFEWKEDVIRPRLQLQKLSRGGVTVTEEELQRAFECKYGKKIDVRMVMFPKDDMRTVMRLYDKIRTDKEEFERQARQCFNSTLAAAAGKVAPIGRNLMAEDNTLEKEAFLLQPGDVSRPIETPQGIIVMRCEGHIPPDTTKKLDDVREELVKEVTEKKLSQAVPKLFKELKDAANPTMILKKATLTAEEQDREVIQQITAPPSASGAVVPATMPPGR